MTTNFTCPRCGHEQDWATECRRCGVIFARLRERYAHEAARRSATATDVGEFCPYPRQPGLLRRIFRIVRWAWIGAGLLVLFLILRPASPPIILIPPDASERADLKVRELRQAADQHRPHVMQLDQPELNAWLGSNLALQRAAPRAAATAEDSTSSPPSSVESASPTVEQVKSSVRDVRIALKAETMRAFVSFDLYGKEMTLELEGKLTTEAGYLRLEPTSGKLGSLPLPEATLQSAARRLFESPENREKFKLPDGVTSVRVEAGTIRIETK